MKKLNVFIISFIIPIFILLNIIHLETYNYRNYKKIYIQENIEKETSKDLDSLMDITNDLIEYLRLKKVDLSKNFNIKEIMHMEDVRNIYIFTYIAKYISLIFLLISLFTVKDIEVLDKSIKYLFGWWPIIIFIFLMMSTRFNSFFTVFHKILFRNDLWLLDPSKDLLIQMLPEIFFINLFKKVTIYFIVSLIIFHAIVYILRSYKKDRVKEEI